jgi:glycosyltransferase involved in cell wall biosynthesis
MDISLVICTRNRSKYLQEALQNLIKFQGDTDWELVVVNNGSTDDTIEALNQFGRQFFHPFEIVNEPRAGLGRARNAGWRVTHGKVVAFTDDDCLPSADYFHRILERFDNDKIDFLGGRILLYDSTDYPITIQTLDRPVTLQPGDFVPAGLIQGANFAFRRSSLESVGGFDERMGAGTPFACEDVDILARLLANGFTGAYSPHPLVYHHHRRKTALAASKLMKTYDYGRGAYYAKCLINPGLRKLCKKYWFQQARQNNALKTGREIVGAIHFMSHVLFA